MITMRRFTVECDSPLLTETCPACKKDFEKGDAVTLIPIGPGDDAEAQEKARSGGYYNAVAIAAHYACVTGEP
jgi:hypothetical protein